MLGGFFLPVEEVELILANMAKTFNKDKQLSWSNVRVSEHMVMVKTVWSKTRQREQEPQYFPIFALPGSTLCPVRAFKQLQHTMGNGKKDHCFVNCKGKSLTYARFMAILKKAWLQCQKGWLQCQTFW